MPTLKGSTWKALHSGRHYTWPAKDKHSSLLETFVSYSNKKFYDIGTQGVYSKCDNFVSDMCDFRSLVLKLFTAVIYYVTQKAGVIVTENENLFTSAKTLP